MSNPTRLPKAIADSVAAAAAIEEQMVAPPAPVDPAPAPPAEPAPTPSSTEPPRADAVDPDLEHKYKTLQGMHNAQIRKLQATQEELNDLRAKFDSTRQAPAFDAEMFERSLSTLREQLGEELANAFDQRIETAVARAIATHVTPLRDVVSSSVDREQQRLTDAFYDRLDLLAPNWEALNKDQAFIDWLNQYDPASGTRLFDHLKDAEAKLDVDRAARFFLTFEREVVARSKAPSPAPMPQTHSAPLPQPNQPRLLRAAEIGKFYEDLRRGVYRGRDAEVAAFEREIASAQREGRVVP